MTDQNNEGQGLPNTNEHQVEQNQTQQRQQNEVTMAMQQDPQ